MATIITVHGTNATGPEEGNSWWQRGSEFEKTIHGLVEDKDGRPIRFQPHVWDGANSEASRRNAAQGLLGRVKKLEQDHESYCLIGHSHGGSVIAHALMQGSSLKPTLPMLGRWITVGTPYIVGRRAFSLFSRLGVFGQAAYVTLLTYMILFTLPMMPQLIHGSHGFLAMPFYQVWILWAILLSPIFLVYCVTRWRTGRRLLTYSAKHNARASGAFANRWVSFWHRDDEAIGSLTALPRLKFKLFPEDFAASSLSMASLFIVPIAIIYMLLDPTVVRWASGHLGAPHLQTQWDSAAAHDNFGAKVELLWNVVAGFVEKIMSALGNPDDWRTPIALFFALPFILFLVTLAITYAIVLLSRYVSAVLSRIMNFSVWQQIRKTAYGSDLIGESSVAANTSPYWILNSLKPLPVVLSDEISNISNTAASTAIVKYRAMIGKLTSQEQGMRDAMLAEYLTWDELIHCCYFTSSRFRMLVAYTISQAEGFRPSAAFRNHPDYELVASWYEAILPKRVESGATLVPLAVSEPVSA